MSGNSLTRVHLKLKLPHNLPPNREEKQAPNSSEETSISWRKHVKLNSDFSCSKAPDIIPTRVQNGIDNWKLMGYESNTWNSFASMVNHKSYHYHCISEIQYLTDWHWQSPYPVTVRVTEDRVRSMMQSIKNQTRFVNMLQNRHLIFCYRVRCAASFKQRPWNSYLYNVFQFELFS